MYLSKNRNYVNFPAQNFHHKRKKLSRFSDVRSFILDSQCQVQHPAIHSYLSPCSEVTYYLKGYLEMKRLMFIWEYKDVKKFGKVTSQEIFALIWVMLTKKMKLLLQVAWLSMVNGTVSSKSSFKKAFNGNN